MAALAGEPWRGAARAAIFNVANNTIGRDAWVTFSVSAAAPTGDQAIWGWATEEGGSGTHSTALTLRFRWANRSGGGVEDDPNFATVEMRVPGGAIVGAAWSVAFPAANTEVTRTFHFDSDPLSQVLDALRAGTLELYLNWGNSGGLAPWTVDSRGGSTGVDIGNSNDWARGYARSRAVLSSNSISNVALAGAEPALWALPDSIFTRIGLATVVYRSISPTLTLRRPSNGTQERGAAHAGGTGANFDYSWTATDGGQTAQVSDSMQAASEAKDLRWDFAALDFGGDNEYVWATSGHQSGWTRDSDLSLRYPARITVDPRNTTTHHFQTENDTFTLAADDNTNQMLSTQSGFLWAIIKNARGEGINGLSVTQTLDPVAAGPPISGSGTTSTQDGQVGVSARLDWTASKPGGAWNKTVDITAPATADGDSYLLNSSDTLTLLAVDPRVRVVVYLGQSGSGASGRHLEPGDSLKATVTAFSTETRKRLVPDTGTVGLTLIRWNEGLSRFEYVQSDGATWAEWSGTGTAATSITMTDSGDGVTFTTTLATTNGWGLHDIVAVNVVLKISGTPYSEYTPREMVASNHRHDEAPNTGGGADLGPLILNRMREGLTQLNRQVTERIERVEKRVTTIPVVDVTPITQRVEQLQQRIEQVPVVDLVPVQIKLQEIETILMDSSRMDEIAMRQAVIEEDLDALLALTVRK